VGNVIRWEQSINGGSTWVTIANTTTSQSYTNLTQTTMFRAVVQNSVCSAANSSAATITVSAVTGGGTVSGSATLCSLTNNGTLTLSGHTGSVVRWESSIDGGANWTTIANTTTTQSYTNVATTTQYRAVVQSGSCGTANSSVATLTLNRVLVTITVSPDSLVCTGTTIVFSATIVNGGTTPTYSWKKNGVTAGTSSTLSQTSSNYVNNDVYSLVITSNASCVVGSPATSNAIKITKYPTSVGGTVSANTSLCSPTNSGTLTLTGNTGNVIRWEQSTNGGSSWTPIANTSATLSYSNVTQTTQYRAVVQSGNCSTANSSAATLTYSPVVGGTTSGAATVCAPTNSGTITASGFSPSVAQWERSFDNGATYNNINSTSGDVSFNYSNLSDTTMYRVRVTNGNCTVWSTVTTITVNESIGGTTSSTTLCLTDGTVTLSGHSGDVVGWDQSINGGTTWTPITNTTTTQSYTGLTQTTLYRARVQEGSCTVATSSSVTVTPAKGGTTTGSTTVCAPTNSGSISLSGQVGTISRWESSTNGFANINNISTSATSITYSNLTQTTQYRARLTNGSCIDFSTVTTITVTPASVGGSVSGTTTVCPGSNGATMNLTGQTGSVIRWEQSINGGANWTTINNTTTSQSYTNLTQTTMFRAVVQSGSCTTANSSAATITVTNVVGGTTSGSATVCTGTNSGSLTLTGQTGTIAWERSTDGGTNWTATGTTTTTQSYTNLTQTTMYRARLTVSGCTAFSTTSTITVSPVSVGGTVSSSATVCSDGNSGSVTLSGHTGNVIRWEQSINGGGAWTTISNTTTTQSYTNLTQTTMFRAVVQSGPCSVANSAAATITVTQIAGGTVSGSTTVCPGTNSGSLTLSGQTGTIVRWESSTNSGGSWTNISNTTSTQSYTNLASTTQYRVLIQSGTCSAYSSVGTITMNTLPTLSSSLTGTVTTEVPINYTPTSATGGTTFAWTRAAVTGIAETASSGSGTITEALTNTAGVPVAVTYVFTLTSPSGCVNTQNVVITVNPSEGGRIITGIIKPQTNLLINSDATLEVTAVPNPTTSYFNLVIKGNKDRSTVVRVTDVKGKPIEQHQKVMPGSVLRLGDGWGAGIYIIEIIQDDKRKTIKIIKTN